MSGFSRRNFLVRGSMGLAAAGVGGLSLRAGAAPTPASGELGAYGDFLKGRSVTLIPPVAAPKAFAATEDNIWGPYYRKGSPYRAKITPPLAEGVVLVIQGRVWGIDTRKPLAGAVLDIWQADHHGRYDNDEEEHPPADNLFVNRARVTTDETGYYEYETVHPGRYKIGPDAWRPSHVHYLVRHPGYKPLVTQLYFKGDPHNAADQFIKPSLIIEVQNRAVGTRQFEAGVFDVVLAG
jgi:catechol 1,2-dioxygenase